MSKFTFEADFDFAEQAAKAYLKQHLEWANEMATGLKADGTKSDIYRHPDDIKFSKKLAKKLNWILRNYIGDDNGAS